MGVHQGWSPNGCPPMVFPQVGYPNGDPQECFPQWSPKGTPNVRPASGFPQRICPKSVPPSGVPMWCFQVLSFQGCPPNVVPKCSPMRPLDPLLVTPFIVPAVASRFWTLFSAPIFALLLGPQFVLIQGYSRACLLPLGRPGIPFVSVISKFSPAACSF
jgi:hypothetical protein